MITAVRRTEGARPGVQVLPRRRRTSLSLIQLRPEGFGAQHAQPAAQVTLPSLLMVSRDLTKVLNDCYPAEAETRDYLEQLGTLSVASAPIMTPAQPSSLRSDDCLSRRCEIVIVIIRLAVIRASRDRAPAVLFSAVADIDPPTGIPRNTPAITFAAPCPMKSRDASG